MDLCDAQTVYNRCAPMRYDLLHWFASQVPGRSSPHACLNEFQEICLRRRLMFVVSYLASIGALVLLWLVYPKVGLLSIAVHLHEPQLNPAADCV